MADTQEHIQEVIAFIMCNISIQAECASVGDLRPENNHERFHFEADEPLLPLPGEL